ncbi:origin recognition complex subunit 4, partial [Recurvomyces mirabilis]
MADADRARKRRKLDNTTRAAPASTPASQRKSSNYISKKPGFQIRTSDKGESTRKGTSTGKDAWAEVKARGYGLHPSQKKAELDVYDDIDGAHPCPPKKTASTGKRKERLDPLRNQRAEAASSPIKKPSSSAAAGFFKQFHAPRAEGARDDVKSLETANGPHAEEGRHDGQSDIAAAASDKSKDEDRTALRYTSRTDQDRQQRVKAADRWLYESDGPASTVRATGNGRRKTFEDEIRELEEAAKRKVEQEAKAGEDDDLEEASATERRSGRECRIVVREVVQATPRPKATTNRRKTNGPNERGTHDGDITKLGPPAIEEQSDAGNRLGNGDEVTAEDDVEIDESEDAVPKPTEATPTKALAARPHRPTPSKVKLLGSQPNTSIRSHEFEPDDLQAIQSTILDQLTGRRAVRLTNLEDEGAKVSIVISQTITAGESNSMLLIGARGSGKTALVNQILHQQAREHADDFHVVRLNGFIHTDDKIALREIWRQLGRKMELDEAEGPAKNYADTLATLLALLSHPAEQGRDQPGQVTKSVIFILDDFELFATHPRQTLLYNLFDIAQSRKAPIAVLGLTTKIDVSESLEKRVKSRFSHRYMHLGLAKSFAAYRESCKAALSISGDTDLAEATREAWGEVIDHFLSSYAVEQHLRRLYYTTKSVSDFMSSLLLPMATLPTGANTTSRDVLNHLTAAISATALSPHDNKLTLLPSLSTLQLALLICATRLTAIYNTELVSFLLAYEEYKILASKAKIQASVSGGVGGAGRTSGKEIARVAWRELIDCGFVIEDGRGGGGGGGSGRVDVGLEELGMCGADL